MAGKASLTLPEKIVTFVGASAAATEKAANAMRKHAEAEKQAAALIPDVVQALIDNDRLEEGLRKDAEAALRDPIKALQILRKVAAHRNVAEQGTLGRPATEKAAAARGPSPFAGRRDANPEQSESYKALARGLGLAQ